jgi:hypothetical protein
MPNCATRSSTQTIVAQGFFNPTNTIHRKVLIEFIIQVYNFSSTTKESGRVQANNQA